MTEPSGDTQSGKVILVTLHYAPFPNTTSGYMTDLATALAQDGPMLVLSGAPNSAANVAGTAGQPRVIEIKSWWPDKSALVSRAIAVVLFTVQAFFSVLKHARRGDAVIAITTTFTAPYAVTLAARLRGAAPALIIYDVYPDSLVLAGVIARTSLLARMLTWANGVMFKWLDAVVVIGRDMKALVAAYPSLAENKIVFIPNWSTLPVRYRDIDAKNPFRRGHEAQFIVGMSGTSGFTHDPESVLEAARLLRGDTNIHFLLSGQGVGWSKLQDMQAAMKLANVTLVEYVPQSQLEYFLAGADVWIIPYRKNNTGISVPSRIYNLLAIGRPVIICSEPEAEGALLTRENDIGWVVPPGNPQALATAIREAASGAGTTADKGRRAASTAPNYAREPALKAYKALVSRLRS